MDVFRAQIVGRGLDFGSPFNQARLEQFCLSNPGKWVRIEAETSERTLSELRMYRAWLRDVAAHTGNDESELHEFLLEKCAPSVVVTIKGRKGAVEIERKKRTSGGHKLTMSKVEMSEYMAKCAEITGYPLPTEEELRAMGYLPQ